MDKAQINERKNTLLKEASLENRSVALGKKYADACVISILISRALLSFLQAVFFTTQYPGFHMWIPLTVLPLVLILKFINEGIRGFSYITLIDSVIFMILHFTLIYHTANDTLFKEIYTNVFIIVMILQFVSSAIMLFNQKSDAYFTAIQRINIKVHGEVMLKKKH